MKKILIFAFGLIVLNGPLSRAERDFSNVEIKTIPVSKNIAMLEGSGGNIGVVHGADGLLIIDDQFEALGEKIKKALSTFKSGDVKFVLNTHWHADHTGGNVIFGKEGTIVSHENVRKRLSRDQFITLFNKTVAASPAHALPIITFEESINIYFNEQDIVVLHLPNGHTDGDSVVYFSGENVMHTGDLFFNGFYPFIDLEHGGSVAGYIQNVKSLLEIANSETKIIPGHGPLATYADLKSFLQMLEGTSAFVREQIKLGVSLEDIQNKGIPSEWDSWKKGFLNDATWISILYSEFNP